MRSHLAARNVYRQCLVRHDTHVLGRSAVPFAGAAAAASFSTTTCTAHSACSLHRPRSSSCCCMARPAIRTPAVPTPAVRPTQRRTFLSSLRRPPPRQLKEQQVEPGYDVLLQFRTTVAEDTRRPARADLVQAFCDFFTYKYQYGKRVNATQAQWMLKMYEYLSEEDEQGGAGERAGVWDLTLEDLRAAREALAKPPGGNGITTSADDHLALCKRVYTEMQRRGAATAVDFKRHITVLCQYGAATEAAELFSRYRDQPPGPGPGPGGRSSSSSTITTTSRPLSRRDKELWVVVLAGLAREGREAALLGEAAAAEAAGLEYMPLFHETMTTFYARRNDLAQTQAWFDKPIHARLLPTAQTYGEILAFSQRSSRSADKTSATSATSATSTAAAAAEKQAWVQMTFQQLCDANPPKDLWDVIFRWAVAALGKGADEIRHMMATMAKHNGHRPHMQPDAATINGLVREAAAQGDVLLAERFVQLGAELAIAADAQTWVLQLDYRVAANDLSGAYASFVTLQGVDCPDEEDAPAVNKYVRALCAAAVTAGVPSSSSSNNNNSNSSSSSSSPNNNNTARLRDVLDAVETRQVALEPATVVALCMCFLQLDRQLEVVDVLSVHAMQFSVEERAVVREAFVDYMVDRRRSSTARAWDAYSLLRQYFAETPPASRVRAMDGFFRRRRPDMACYVFGHMRGASGDDAACRPTAAMYVRCLEGLARCPDAAGLHMVHNMLKMDTLVQLDTRLYNALMLAYAACGDPDRALDFWHDISASAEGPSYASLAAVFWVCERLPFGDAPARAIWAKIQRMEIDVPPAVYDAYVGAIAGQGRLPEAQTLVAGMVKSAGYGPTATTLAIAHNALPGQTLQADFAGWAAAEYPDLWQQTTKRGCRSTVEGLRRYNVQREMKA